jgi:hypothetical protein
LSRIDENLKSGDVQGAMEVCKSTQGPTASILYEGLKNADEGPEAVEKAIVSYGSVQMGLARAWFGLDFSFHRNCPDAWFHGYGNWYDSGI